MAQRSPLLQLWNGTARIGACLFSPHQRSASLLTFSDALSIHIAFFAKAQNSLTIGDHLHVGSRVTALAISPRSVVSAAAHSAPRETTTHEIVLAAASEDNVVRIFSNNTSSDGAWRAVSLTDHTASINALAFNYDGGLLGTACDDAFARLFDVETQTCIRSIPCCSPVMAFVWHPHDPKELLRNADDDEFVIGEQNGAVSFFRQDQGDLPVSSLIATTQPLTDLDWNPRQPDRIVAYADGRCLVWSMQTSSLPQHVVDVGGYASGLVRWSRVSERIVAVGSVESVDVYRMHEDASLVSLAHVDGHATAITWHANSSACVVAMGSLLVLISSGV